VLLPVCPQVAQQVEGGSIQPVQVIQEQHQRQRSCQRIKEARHRFEQMPLGGQIILGGEWQVGVAYPQLRQQARQFGQPQVLQQVLRGVFRFQPRPDGLDQRLIGQPSSHLEGMPTEHLAALGPDPGRKLARQPCFADAGLPQHQHDLRLSLPCLLKGSDELAEGPRPSRQRGHQLRWRAALGRGETCRAASRAASLDGADALCQGGGFRRGLDLQRLGQLRTARGVDLQRGARIAQREMHAHQAPIGLLR
jgi:hypothetical protein